jgi:flavin-dependent dehydrogenase
MTTILGSGISGLTAAINLAKKGIATDVYEKNKEVGMRFQGDLQGLENWSEKKDILEELKKINIEINFDCAPFSKVTLTNCSKTREIETKRPLFYLVKRGPFPGTIDHGLREQALKLGVNMHFGKTISHNKANIVATGPNPNKLCGVVKGIIFKTNFKDTAIINL